MTELEWIEIFSGNLKDIMDEVGITQNDLARDSGLDKSVISRYLSGKCMPSVKSLINICHAIPELDAIDIFESLIYFGDRIV